ncbi:MAG: DUF1501 domain-containing protein [Saprospiraceae bacterium]|nr:DUF1501 domain-containing protein [Saprospiraceae bacterium]
MCDNHKNKREGRSIEDQQAHENDHLKWRRRDFLQTAGLFTAGMAATLNGVPVYAMGNVFQMAPLASLETDRVLVLIQLRGGNDGLNMVIDRFNPEYYKIRPTIAVTESNLWALDEKNGMPNRMIDLQPLWEEDKMKVIHNVGYPHPNYSHFRSSDIWASASDTDEYLNTGWIGRYIDYDMPAFLDAQPTVPPAMQIGVQTDLVFQGAEANLALAISSPQEFYKLAVSGQLYSLENLGMTPKDIELFYVRQVANSAFRYSQSISDAYNKGRNEVNYPTSNLAQQLAIVSRLIKGRLGTKVYMVYIDGFDTHAEQNNRHPNLLNNMASAVRAFYDDLARQDMDGKVLGMTFSEFGRTIYENGSTGTDHGTSAPMLLFSKGLGKDVVGNAPDLINTDQYGDPVFSTDFRDVYGTVLGSWFGMPKEVTDFIIGKEPMIIPGLVPEKKPPVGSEEFGALLGHRISPSKADTVEIRYAVNQGGPMIMELLDKTGQVIRTFWKDAVDKGSHTLEVDLKQYAIKPGQYSYRMKVGGKIYQRTFEF